MEGFTYKMITILQYMLWLLQFQIEPIFNHPQLAKIDGTWPIWIVENTDAKINTCKVSLFDHSNGSYSHGGAWEKPEGPKILYAYLSAISSPFLKYKQRFV